MRIDGSGYTLDFRHQCAAWTINNQGPARKQCGLPPNQNIDQWIYLCSRHYELIFRAVEREVDNLNSRRVENLQARLTAAEDLIEVAGLEDEPEREPLPEDYFEQRRKAQTVYFMRCEGFVKIGMSFNPDNRLNQIRKGGGSLFPRRMDVASTSLIATEPGGFDREKELHARFASLRHTGEWFTEAPELTEYIESLEGA